ncbi:MAG: transcription elongation factor GreA [Erysipelotrichales bacterium]|nr:transcription elongation factor GreA [Erysipelotrichales bacterium]
MELEKVLITKEGLDKLNQELKNLKEVQRAEVIEELRDARAQGDLSENADYDAARNRQAQVESRIREIENMIANAELIENQNDSKKKIVRLGSTITILDKSDDIEYTYTIVGSVEADPLQGKVSNEAPLSQALMNHVKGDKVTVRVKDPYEVVILKIN